MVRPKDIEYPIFPPPEKGIVKPSIISKDEFLSLDGKVRPALGVRQKALLSEEN